MRRPSLQHLPRHVSQHREHMLSYVKRESERERDCGSIVSVKNTKIHLQVTIVYLFYPSFNFKEKCSKNMEFHLLLFDDLKCFNVIC